MAKMRQSFASDKEMNSVTLIIDKIVRKGIRKYYDSIFRVLSILDTETSSV